MLLNKFFQRFKKEFQKNSKLQTKAHMFKFNRHTSTAKQQIKS